MRQFKLREEKSFVKILKEPPAAKPKVNWSRRVYIAIFLVVAFLFIKRIYNANMIIFANGQIDLPKQTVKFPNDIKLLELNIKEGSQVCQGDTLFAYNIMGDQIDQAKLSISTPGSNDWIIREQLAINKKIELNKILIQQKGINLDYLNETIKTKESLLLGGIHDEYQAYSGLQNQKANLLAEMQLHKREIEILRKHIGRLYGHRKINEGFNMNQLKIYEQVQYYVAPIDGVISDIFYAVNEICYKKDEMVTIHQMNNATINTYFDPEEVQHLKVGDMVTIEFPDKTESLGIISKFFVSTYAVPSEFQKKYEPTERNIVAEIVPFNKQDDLAWNSYYKMEVNVQKKRYDFKI